MTADDDFKKYVDRGYCGKIFHGPYSKALKKRLAQCIAGFRLFERTGHPAIPYVAAWGEEENLMWYEYASKRLTRLMRCGISDIARVFRESIIERRIYRHQDTDGGVKQEALRKSDLDKSRTGLRDEGKRKGLVEAIYKMSLDRGRIIWLKDQASVETFEQDGISISLGCLTDISKEMEAEEALKRTERALQRANQQLQRLATLDGLTQIANRRRFDEHLNQEWRRLSREHAPISLIMSDIDHFKHYNDTYGHQMGDDCLKAVARAISETARRPADLAARYGGEEFAVILPNTSASGALQVARDIQKEIEGLNIPHDSSPVSPRVTLSLGVATMVPDTRLPPETIVERADRALYQAKEQGRNRIIMMDGD